MDGCPPPPLPPVIPQEVVEAWQAGVTRLIQGGVTGRILLGNIGSPRGVPVSGWFM